eukprot:56357-Chlamydomonas_euryale.AAC.4
MHACAITTATLCCAKALPRPCGRKRSCGLLAFSATPSVSPSLPRPWPQSCVRLRPDCAGFLALRAIAHPPPCRRAQAGSEHA